MPDPITLPADALPGLMTGWCGPVLCQDSTRSHDWGSWACWDGRVIGLCWSPTLADIRLDTSRHEVRDRVARVIAAVLGVPVGATAPEIKYCHEPQCVQPGCFADPSECRDCARKNRLVINARGVECPRLDLPEWWGQEAMLSAVAVWLGDEIRAGRIVPVEAPHA